MGTVTPINFEPPAGVRAASKRGLSLHADGKSGDGRPVGPGRTER